MQDYGSRDRGPVGRDSSGPRDGYRSGGYRGGGSGGGGFSSRGPRRDDGGNGFRGGDNRDGGFRGGDRNDSQNYRAPRNDGPAKPFVRPSFVGEERNTPPRSETAPRAFVREARGPVSRDKFSSAGTNDRRPFARRPDSDSAPRAERTEFRGGEAPRSEGFRSWNADDAGADRPRPRRFAGATKPTTTRK